MSNFEHYHVGDIMTVASSGYITETIYIKPEPYVFDPQIDGYLAWLPPSEADFLALVGWRVKLKGVRNNNGASTEPHPFIKHLMRATGSPSVTSLALRFNIDPSTLRKYMTPFTTQNPIRWISIHRLRAMVANASVDQNTKHSKNKLPKEIAENVRKFSLLTTAETGSMIRVLDQDELYARVALSWRVRFGERKNLKSPTAIDLPWLLVKAREIATSLWNDHTRFQQLCLEEIATKKGLTGWNDCRVNMHPA